MFIPCFNGLLMDFLANVYPIYWIPLIPLDRSKTFLGCGRSGPATGRFFESPVTGGQRKFLKLLVFSPQNKKKWGEISSKSEQTWFFRGFSFAELLYVLEIQTNIEWITNKKPAGSHEYAWLRIDQSEAALESHNHHHHQKITILWLYIISSYLYDVQLFYPDSILCLWLNHAKPC